MAGKESRAADVRYGDGSIRARDRKDGGKSYQARWHDGIKWRAKTFHGPIEKAEDFLRQRARDVRSGKYVADEDVTLLDAIDDYLRRGETHRDWKPNTRATYGSVRDMVARLAIANLRLSEITPRHCQVWIDTMAGIYSASRMIVIRAVVGGALKEATRLGSINANPMHDVRMASPKKREYIVWTADQAHQAIAVSRRNILMHAYYTVALNTGMRPGELRALLWKDVDLEGRSITVSATMTRSADHSPMRGTSTKGGRSRRIAISDDVVAALRAYSVDQKTRQLRAESWSHEGYVFDRGNGTYLPQQTVARWHKSFCETYGLPVCRLHDLRHSCVSILLEAGVDIMVVSELLGHVTVRTTQDVYGHITDVQLRNVAGLMQSVLGERRKV